MDTRFPTGLLNIFLPDQLAGTNRTQQSAVPSDAKQKQPSPSQSDFVDLSSNRRNNVENQNGVAARQPRLVSESVERLENGFRRTQEFENKDGRSFTRIEEFTTTSDRAHRTVIQQNDSGSTTVLEDILDRQDDGQFRLTRRFTDETGETTTDIQFNIKPLDADILLGRAPEPDKSKDNPFQPLRGTEFDIKT